MHAYMYIWGVYAYVCLYWGVHMYVCTKRMRIYTHTLYIIYTYILYMYIYCCIPLCINLGRPKFDFVYLPLSFVYHSFWANIESVACCLGGTDWPGGSRDLPVFASHSRTMVTNEYHFIHFYMGSHFTHFSMPHFKFSVTCMHWQ